MLGHIEVDRQLADIYPITHRTLEQLEEELISFSERMNGWEYEYLVLIREFDIRQGWKASHF